MPSLPQLRRAILLPHYRAKAQVEVEHRVKRRRKLKTAKMQLLEQLHGKDIRELLLEGTSIELAERFDTTPSVIHQWWKRFHIENSRTRRKNSK